MKKVWKYCTNCHNVIANENKAYKDYEPRFCARPEKIHIKFTDIN